MDQSLMDDRRIAWRKSSYSGGSGSGNCVEIAAVLGAVAIRDSKDPDGLVLLVEVETFRRLIARLRGII